MFCSCFYLIAVSALLSYSIIVFDYVSLWTLYENILEYTMYEILGTYSITLTTFLFLVFLKSKTFVYCAMLVNIMLVYQEIV